jgi:predicted transcriptional regulator
MVDYNDMLKLAAYVELSGYRERVLKVLNDAEVMTPKYIAKASDIRDNHISKTLRELKENDLVVCINEEARKGRLYKITPLGVDVLKLIPKIKGKSIGELNDL